METRAVAKYIRISPQKARSVADAVRGKNVGEAYGILKFTPRKAARLIERVLASAVANAENNFDMDAGRLYVSQIFIDEGPTIKRFKPRAQGRADMIRKRTSHITVVVTEREV